MVSRFRRNIDFKFILGQNVVPDDSIHKCLQLDPPSNCHFHFFDQSRGTIETPHPYENNQGQIYSTNDIAVALKNGRIHSYIPNYE